MEVRLKNDAGWGSKQKKEMKREREKKESKKERRKTARKERKTGEIKWVQIVLLQHLLYKKQ